MNLTLLRLITSLLLLGTFGSAQAVEFVFKKPVPGLMPALTNTGQILDLGYDPTSVFCSTPTTIRATMYGCGWYKDDAAGVTAMTKCKGPDFDAWIPSLGPDYMMAIEYTVEHTSQPPLSYGWQWQPLWQNAWCPSNMPYVAHTTRSWQCFSDCPIGTTLVRDKLCGCGTGQ